jgi:hypothetical protein
LLVRVAGNGLPPSRRAMNDSDRKRLTEIARKALANRRLDFTDNGWQCLLCLELVGSCTCGQFPRGDEEEDRRER